MQGKKVSSVDLADSIFGIEPNAAVMHMMVVSYLASQRQGTQSALTRSEVSGGGRKPWRQKGTGHARQGSIRAAQWKGGGIIFAPKPRDYEIRLNKKEKRAALKSALTSRVQEEKIFVIDAIKCEEIKTKTMAELLKGLNLSKALIVLNENDQNVICSARNIEGVKTALTNTINTFDILKYDALVIDKAALATIEEVYA
jgi:large subunit ribosomal protein L4